MVQLNISVPSEFFREEVICGYTVSRKMKEVWAVELDLLTQVDNVCSKYGIKYFASGGTLLGAIRHQGFIPWDDDIDLAMTRSEYDRLCDIASKEFTYPYFFQTEYTDHGSLRGHAQVRNSLTTGILKGELKSGKKINQGIFIDIFPLDGVSDNQHEYVMSINKIQKLKANYLFYNKLAYPGILNLKSLKSVVKNVLSFFMKEYSKKHISSLYFDFEKECSRFNCENTKFLSMLSFRADDKRLYIEKVSTNKIKRVKFEFISLPILEDYDTLLKRQYGDYMVMKHDQSYHGGIIFDTDKPYTEYLK
jgi:lipopolysaccharide cholinephosphotransferase